MITLRKVSWAKRVACIENMIHSQDTSETRKGEIPVEEFRHRWEGNLEISLEGT
jgi:hypothetical protein